MAQTRRAREAAVQRCLGMCTCKPAAVGTRQEIYAQKICDRGVEGPTRAAGCALPTAAQSGTSVHARGMLAAGLVRHMRLLISAARPARCVDARPPPRLHRAGSCRGRRRSRGQARVSISHPHTRSRSERHPGPTLPVVRILRVGAPVVVSSFAVPYTAWYFPSYPPCRPDRRGATRAMRRPAATHAAERRIRGTGAPLQ
eukprot:250228-Chlamydomonas_euryale.AAC.2